MIKHRTPAPTRRRSTGGLTGYASAASARQSRRPSRPGIWVHSSVAPTEHGNVARGEFVSVEPPTRVVFTWGWEGEGNPIPPGASTVEVTLTPDGDGTVLRLVHRDLPLEAQGAHADGWDHFLPRLVEAAAGRDPGRDPWSERGEGGA